MPQTKTCKAKQTVPEVLEPVLEPKTENWLLSNYVYSGCNPLVTLVDMKVIKFTEKFKS